MKYFGTNLTQHGHFTYDLSDGMTKMYTNFSGLPFNPEELTNHLPKGEVIFYQGGGYTVLGISGSCVDERPGTHSIFWVKEVISKIWMIQRINGNAASAKIIKAMPFEIMWDAK